MTTPTLAGRAPEDRLAVSEASAVRPDTVGEGPGTYKCTSCGIVATAGELLLVTPTDGTRPYPICRPGLSPRCFRLAGRADQATIAVFDAEAARRWDREHGGAKNDRLDDNLAKAAADAAERARHPEKGWT